MNISVERTDEAIVVKLPLNTKILDLQQMLDYFEYVDLASNSKATQAQVDKLAKEVNQNWWQKNKTRFLGKPDFEDVE